MNTEQIKGYFAFDDEDLVANRVGRLSPGQEKKLTTIDRSAKQTILVMAVLALLAGLGLGAYFYLTPPDDLGTWGCPGILLLAALWLFSGFFRRSNLSVQQVRGPVSFEKRIESEGPAYAAEADPRARIYYQMLVGGEGFEVDTSIPNYIKDGNVYAVYFIDKPRKVLSIEFVSGVSSS